jgi:hypothetical protein
MRWSPGRVQTWRPASEGGFLPNRYEVTKIGEAAVRHFCIDRHYSGTYPAARLRYGLYDLTPGTPVLSGVAVLAVPANRAVLTQAFPGLEPYAESLELSRFVLDDDVPLHRERWFLPARSARLGPRTPWRGIPQRPAVAPPT